MFAPCRVSDCNVFVPDYRVVYLGRTQMVVDAGGVVQCDVYRLVSGAGGTGHLHAPAAHLYPEFGGWLIC